MNRVIRYTPRDMTVTVEAGVTVGALSTALAAEGQQLPIDAPFADDATVGGCVAVNQSGPRRYGHGTLRDYVIGIQAIDGRGTPFRGGGNVVKNVAGYDFCKMHCGALGTLGVITELTFKVKPLPEQVVTLRVDVSDWQGADSILASLSTTHATPAAIDLVAGPQWNQAPPLSTAAASCVLVIRLEGTSDEVTWMQNRLVEEIGDRGGNIDAVADPEAVREQLTRFPTGALGEGQDPPLIGRIAVPPSDVTSTVEEIQQWDPECSVMAHAGTGVVVVHFRQFSEDDLSRRWLAELQPAAVRRGGSCVLLSSRFAGLTRQLVWGGRNQATVLMERIREQFDPQQIFNRGRFIY